MAQHDANIADAPGQATRLDINDAFAALFSNSAGISTPTTTRAGQLWFDNHLSTKSTLWIRNNANTAWIRMFDIDDSAIVGLGFTNLDDVKTINGGPLQGLRNAIINGDFDIWQRNYTQTTAENGYYSVDRWANEVNTSTKTVDRMLFDPGQTEVPGNPKYYMRYTVLTSGNIVSSYAVTSHRIEGVDLFSGKLVTVTLYAKADAAKTIGVEFYQTFGSGGTPSSSVSSGGTPLSLTTSWKKFTFTKMMPSIAGKVLGTSNNDNTRFYIFFEAGSNYATRNGGVPNQTGVFDIAHVSLVEGDATQEDDPFSPRPFAQELELCQRYYENSYNLATPVATITQVGNSQQMVLAVATGVNNAGIFPIPFKTRKRGSPTMTFYSPISGAAGMGVSFYGTDTDIPVVASGTGENGTNFSMSDTRNSTYVNYAVHWQANAEL